MNKKRLLSLDLLWLRLIKMSGVRPIKISGVHPIKTSGVAGEIVISWDRAVHE